MNKSKIIIAIISTFVGAFVAAIATLSYIDARVNIAMASSIAANESAIEANKKTIADLSQEMRVKADVALFVKYDRYFESINADMTKVKSDLAYIKGQLDIRLK